MEIRTGDSWCCDRIFKYPLFDASFVLLVFFFPVESVGISDELKTKLKDVLIQEQQFTLGRMLGKGKNQNWTRLYTENLICDTFTVE